MTTQRPSKALPLLLLVFAGWSTCLGCDVRESSACIDDVMTLNCCDVTGHVVLAEVNLGYRANRSVTSCEPLSKDCNDNYRDVPNGPVFSEQVESCVLRQELCHLQATAGMRTVKCKLPPAPYDYAHAHYKCVPAHQVHSVCSDASHHDDGYLVTVHSPDYPKHSAGYNCTKSITRSDWSLFTLSIFDLKLPQGDRLTMASVDKTGRTVEELTLTGALTVNASYPYEEVLLKGAGILIHYDKEVSSYSYFALTFNATTIPNYSTARWEVDSSPTSPEITQPVTDGSARMNSYAIVWLTIIVGALLRLSTT